MKAGLKEKPGTLPIEAEIPPGSLTMRWKLITTMMTWGISINELADIMRVDHQKVRDAIHYPWRLSSRTRLRLLRAIRALITETKLSGGGDHDDGG